MKNVSIFCSILGLLTFLSCKKEPKEITSVLEFVNPFIGTGGHGHTYPGATVPFGMVQLSPDTRLEGWDGCSGYHYTDSIIYGFSHTHLSGTGVSDYGDVLLMPTQGTVYFDNGYQSNAEMSYRSAFRKENEKAAPGFYGVKLDKHNIDVRLTTTVRAGMHEYTFNQASDQSNIILDLLHHDQLLDGSIVVKQNKIIEGKRISKAWATEQHLYFSMEFSKPFTKHRFDSTGNKAAFVFETAKEEKIYVKVGISAVSVEGARKNLTSEMPDFNFENYLSKAEDLWKSKLTKIEIKESNIDKKTIFYTALYHTLIVPNTFSDVDGKYRGMDLMIHKSDNTVYTVFSLWDTFRATHPLYTIIEQEKTNEFIQTFLTQYQDGGILPIWELAGNYTGCMIGYHGVSVIADAYAKGIRNYDTQLALEAVQHSARRNHLGLEAYKIKGFMEVQDEPESVSKVLEYAYDDWCIAQLSKQLGDEEAYREFIQRAQYYKNMFNPEVGFMQSKVNGGWSVGFNPAEVNFNFTEANSWQYSMFVPQDISGMIELYGGKEVFEHKLDQLFTTEIELSGRHQVDITGLIGQYAHGNEPSHHMAYLYNYIGKPHKTQERVHHILTEQYDNRPDGLSGNEDCGQMSAWYVLSSMGFYSVTPGLDYYTIGTPHFEEVKMNLENGKEFTIKAKNLTSENYFIQSATLNGKLLPSAQLAHQSILEGGVLVFEMGSKANKKWATDSILQSSIPLAEQITPVPYFKAESRTFTDSIEVSLIPVNPNDQVFVKINEGEFRLYENPITIYESTQFEAYAKRSNKKSMTVKGVDFRKIKGGRSIELATPYKNEYSAGGDKGLIDLLRGNENFRTGQWQGYWGEDLSAVVDLGQEEKVKRISVGTLQDIKSWIFYPTEVIFYASNDGRKFTELKRIENQFSDKEYGASTQEFDYSLETPLTVRYIKVVAKNYGKIGDWHLGVGNDAWLFVDEIIIE